ncbi:hypothetical protein GCM10007320_36020 [Pseudorhodoferax aquiterrae]|uniref:Uncharacterized protein n=1 Tax=Pseudorhodoferax aquiterrae TaxID=747304 RepID=A0ABQ3G4Q3_9BURK|nr:hypothetical protein GCM10007320_36020 [Pseudorhodoferax aquiterrae]
MSSLTPTTQGSFGSERAAGGATSTFQPLITPLMLAMCGTPGGTQPARCGGSNQEPCGVRTCTRPFSMQKTWPRRCWCQPVSRVPNSNSLPLCALPRTAISGGPSARSLNSSSAMLGDTGTAAEAAAGRRADMAGFHC